MIRSTLASALIALVMSACSGAAGIVNIVFEETPFGVEVTGSGYIHLEGLALEGRSITSAGINPPFGSFGFGQAPLGDFYVASTDFYLKTAVYDPFGSGRSVPATTTSGDFVALFFGRSVEEKVLGVAEGFVSGDPVSFSALFMNTTFHSLGVKGLPATSRLGNNVFYLSANGPLFVPVPAGVVLILTAMGALVGVRALRRG